jgi:anti-sigma factor RsiW
MQCLDEAALIDYLYDEGDATEREVLSAHIASCLRCAEEVQAMQATREELRAWTPPDAVLGFQVVAAPTSATVLRPARWWQQPMPAWAQVAAAVMLFSAGAALGALRTTGAPDAPPAVAATAPSVATPAGDAAPVSTRDLAALEQRLRAEMTQRVSTPTAAPVASRHNDDAVLEQVRTLIRDSERRQQQELTLRTAELVKDVDAQRRGDLARIERTFGQMEGNTGVQVEQQRQLLNYLMRVSQRQPQ